MYKEDIAMELLALGSVVKVKGMKEKRVISGYLRPVSDGRVFDYSSVPFPTGLVNIEDLAVFNAEDVDEVVFSGLNDNNKEVVKWFEAFKPVMEKKLGEVIEKGADAQASEQLD